MKPFSTPRLLLIASLGVLILAGGAVWVKRPPAVDSSRRGDSSKLATAELDPVKQKYIWDTEHFAFELETHFGSPFMKALASRERDQLSRFFHDGFEGWTFGAGGEELRQAGMVTERRRSFDARTASKVGRDGLTGSLIAALAGFARIESSKLRVLHIDRTAAQTNLWKLELLLTFDGFNATNGPAVLESRHRVEARFANDDQIAAGPILTRWQMDAESFRSSPRPLMEEVTESAGLTGHAALPDNWKLPLPEVEQYRFQIAVADFDRDGFLDIAIATLEGDPLLLHSKQGKRFEDVTESFGLNHWENGGGRVNFATAWIDYDNDGYPDLIMGDRLFHNVAGRQLVDVTAHSQLKFGNMPMGIIVADYDCDGLPDIYVLYQDGAPIPAGEKVPWVGDTKSGAENELWHNEGNGVFRNVTAAAHAGGGRRRSFAAMWFFYDQDRFPDLYIANDFGENVLLRNRGDGTFEDVSQASGTANYATSMSVASGDLDNDGQSEIYVATMYSKMGRRIIAHVQANDYPPGIFEKIKGSCAGNHLYWRTPGQTRFEEVSESLGVNNVGWAYAPALVDLDGDGWLDLYAATGFMSFQRGKPDG